MAVDFNAERGDLSFQAKYGAPLFALWKSPDELFGLLFARLSRHALQLNDLKWGPSSGVGDVHLDFYLFNYAAAVHVRMDRVEFEVFDVSKINEQQLQEAATGLVQALRSHEPALSLSAFIVALGYHGKVSGSVACDFTRALTVGPPDGPGPSFGAGAVFYYGAAEDRVSSAVTVDLSSLVPDALFFRVHVVWDAACVNVEDLGVRTRQYVERVFESFGLNPVAVR